MLKASNLTVLLLTKVKKFDYPTILLLTETAKIKLKSENKM